MIVKLERDLTREDIEILIKYKAMNKDVERIAALLLSMDKQILCHSESGEKLINASDIYYIESVDKKTFVYCEKSVYKTDQPLYRLAADLSDLRFAQISKSCVLNLKFLDLIKTLINSQIEVTLKNGERILVTRKYLNTMKQALYEVNV